MLSNDKKLEVAERIIQSNTFKKATTSMALLRYLVEANVEDRFLKEGIIDMEFFGTEAGGDKNSPRVRVNVYNLRKKLDVFYKKEGTREKWKLRIDKGQYSIRFEKNSTEKALLSVHSARILFPYVLLGIAAVGIVISNLPDPKPVIWKSIFNNGKETNLFIGDAFGFRGQTINGSQGWTRDFKVNSLEEYYIMLEEKPELKEITFPTNFYYSTRMAENATHDLTRLFSHWKKDFSIRYTTKASFDELTEGNTIYVGRISNQEKFIYLFNEGNPHFKIKENAIVFSGHESLADTSISILGSGVESDYALVSRISRTDNTEQFLFFSNHDIGVMATVEYFTDVNEIEKFSSEELKGKKSFTALFHVHGQDRIDMKFEKLLVVGF